MMLDDPQQFGLHLYGHLPDLIEANSGAIGDFKPSDPPGIGTGKGPLFPAEQFALDQIIRKRATVDG